MPHNTFNALQDFKLAARQDRQVLLARRAREGAASGRISRLPVSIRIVLESVLRNCDGKKVTEEHVRAARRLEAERAADRRDPVRASRASCCRTSPACRCSSTSRRCAAWRAGMGKNPKVIEPLVPVDLVVDHSVQVDHYGTTDALDLNMELEFQRNRERYQFLKWGMQAFDTFKVVPPGIGIVHQVNLEYLARGVHQASDGVYYPDTLVGTDSHTTMINGIGVVGWGVGGIEAEAGMLGQPVYFLTPDVVGVHLTGRAARRRHRDRPRAHRHRDAAQGEGRRQVRRVLRRGRREPRRARPRDDRQHGARVRRDDGLLPGRRGRPSSTSRGTGRTDEQIDAFAAYFKAQGLFGIPQGGRHRLQPGRSSSTSRTRRAVARRAEAPAGPHRARQREGDSSPSCSRSRWPRTASARSRRTCATRFTTGERASTSAAATC